MTLLKNSQLFLISILLILSGCFNREKEPKPEGYVPPEKMIELLSDLYLADGLLNNPTIRSEYEDKDSIQNYMDIISSYGYTQEQFDASIDYLFSNNPKRLEAIYDRVIANLSSMEADLLKERSSGDNTVSNYYTGVLTIRLPDDGITNKLEIDIPIDRPGMYVLKSRVLIYDDDQSIEPFMNLWFWYDDKTENGHIEPWDTLFFSTRGRSELLTYSRVMIDTNATHIRGYLFNHYDQQGHWEKHANFSNISITVVDTAMVVEKYDNIQ